MHHITETAQETRALAAQFARTLQGGEIVCLDGDLGAGKTTFAQGILESLGAHGPFVSPTFLIMKDYPLPDSKTAYHIDAYRVRASDLLNLGWEEFSTKKESICIIEWPENISDIIPQNAIHVRLKHLDGSQHRIEW